MLDRKLVSIVDDDEFFRDSMRKLVTLLGYPVKSFSSGADFLASGLLSETGCVVADVHMPGMTGIELHKRLIGSGHTIPTILITAYPDPIVREQVLKDGVACYLSKRVDDRELEQCLRTALERRHSNDNS
jgi:FixJ family two-component response regulator